jgi:hypothetical protein
LLLATILTVLASAGIYVWAEYFNNETVLSSGVKVVEFKEPEIAKYVKTSKVTSNMLFAVLKPEFEQLPIDQKREFMQKIRSLGAEKGYGTVSFMNIQGKTIGYASADKIDIPEK